MYDKQDGWPTESRLKRLADACCQTLHCKVYNPTRQSLHLEKFACLRTTTVKLLKNIYRIFDPGPLRYVSTSLSHVSVLLLVGRNTTYNLPYYLHIIDRQCKDFLFIQQLYKQSVRDKLNYSRGL